MEPRNQRNHLERKPKLIRGGRAPLFDRLCGDPVPNHSDGSPQALSRVYAIEDVAESVVRELRSLLNTRLPVAAGMSDESSQTVLNYGLPDFSHLNASSPSDRELLARLIERKITAFEPRLKQVYISLEPHPTQRGSVVGTMSASMQTESFREPVSFLLAGGTSGIIVTGTATGTTPALPGPAVS
jgi:type VI secretion system protein ImpF